MAYRSEPGLSSRHFHQAIEKAATRLQCHLDDRSNDAQEALHLWERANARLTAALFGSRFPGRSEASDPHTEVHATILGVLESLPRFARCLKDAPFRVAAVQSLVTTALAAIVALESSNGAHSAHAPDSTTDIEDLCLILISHLIVATASYVADFSASMERFVQLHLAVSRWCSSMADWPATMKWWDSRAALPDPASVATATGATRDADLAETPSQSTALASTALTETALVSLPIPCLRCGAAVADASIFWRTHRSTHHSIELDLFSGQSTADTASVPIGPGPERPASSNRWWCELLHGLSATTALLLVHNADTTKMAISPAPSWWSDSLDVLVAQGT